MPDGKSGHLECLDKLSSVRQCPPPPILKKNPRVASRESKGANKYEGTGTFTLGQFIATPWGFSSISAQVRPTVLVI